MIPIIINLILKTIMNKLTYLIVLVFLAFGSCKKDPTLAILTTNSAKDITINSFASGGNITNNGGADIIERGVCWGISQNPVITGSRTTDGKGTGSFSSKITGLVPNTKYYIRAYATNSAGTSYGNEVNCTTTTAVPTVTTTVVTDPTLTSAVSGGNITSDGGSAITAGGVCWATTANPDITNSKTSDATGTGTFTSSITELLPGTTYHVRAYATNSIGTAYGIDLTFTTIAISPPSVTTSAITANTYTSAVSGGNISNAGTGTITAGGVCWSTTADPTIVLTTKTADATGTGAFTSNITGLQPGTTYHVRAYATNSEGATAYGSDIQFTTNTLEAPSITTTDLSGITLTSAVSGGVITSDGGSSVTVSGICWSTTADPTTALTTKTTNGSLSGSFSSNITGLLPGTTYYVRAYATNSTGTGYGIGRVFTTNALIPPTVTTTAVTGQTATSAVSGGNITTAGSGTISAGGVCWSTTANPTIALTTKTADAAGTGTFISNITGLLPGTTYHVRAYATNSAGGTAYGNDIPFTTNVLVAPTLTTTAYTLLTATSVRSGGNISDAGGGSITVRGVCWSTTTGPTVALTTKTSDGTGTGSFTSNVTGLLPNTTYYLRAYATNGSQTGYGNELIITTFAATDIDGNNYTSVLIGSQTWLKENLKTTKYLNGDAIPTTTADVSGETNPKYQWAYNNDEGNVSTYGRLYSWYTVTDSRNICPTGWHIPSDTEWEALKAYLGGESVSRRKIKRNRHYSLANSKHRSDQHYRFYSPSRRLSYSYRIFCKPHSYMLFLER